MESTTCRAAMDRTIVAGPAISRTQNCLDGAIRAVSVILAEMHPQTGEEEIDGSVPGRWTAIARLWAARWLLWQWVRRDFVVRYRQSALGAAWALVQPLMLLLFYGIVFVKVLKVDPHRGSYIVFAFCGLAPWTFVVNAVTWGMPSLGSAGGIIKQVYFPRSVVPLAAGGVVLLDLCLSTTALLAMQLAAGEIHLTVVALLPLYVGLAMLVEAFVIFTAVLSAFVRDIRFVLPFVLQVGFIVTPIMYPSTQLASRWRWIFDLNPVAQVVEGVRRSVIDGRWPSLLAMTGLLCGGAIALVLAIFYSDSVEQRLPDLL